MSETNTRGALALGAELIARPSLHDQVVTRLRDMIIEGVLASGTRIHETDLGRRLGVSRTPLREGLKVLASEGLVELIAGRGAVVREFRPKDAHDMLIVLATLEGLAARLACAHGSDADIAAVRDLHDRMMERYAARDRLEYFKLNQSIHSAIVRMADNEPLALMQDQMQARVKRIRFIGHEGPEKWALAVAEHEQMIAALEARDGERLADILSRHLMVTWSRVRDRM
ncbi:GntR family transcriptional regulator [Marinivivus vitaminiproducens]|uniref:GntR family transcriptional regulator n=1 Tax=Marinivivus vitaminiproducens TaxID=3035935 RepID=UPI00279870A6|nr:GntR family transcriptional regulator [Geminicoccaceae bacterium SCSIO 64248]